MPYLEYLPYRWRLSLLALALALISGCTARRHSIQPLKRHGDEIVVCGQLFRIGTPVVTWMDPGGYDAYRVERRFAPVDQADWKSSTSANPELNSPNRYGFRRATTLSTSELEHVRTHGWDLPTLQLVVDQFILHYDASGTSRRCFQVLHDIRGLSVHFLLDADGTIYQTLDLKERAWHATTSNTRGIGIEITQVGAVAPNEQNRLNGWYTKDASGRTRLTYPEWLGDPGLRTRGFVGRPARSEPITGDLHGKTYVQYDFTPEQYAALGKLTLALTQIFPKIRSDFPRTSTGQIRTDALGADELERFQGILGHYHVQQEKIDPGPAFDWERLGHALRK